MKRQSTDEEGEKAENEKHSRISCSNTGENSFSTKTLLQNISFEIKVNATPENTVVEVEKSKKASSNDSTKSEGETVIHLRKKLSQMSQINEKFINEQKELENKISETKKEAEDQKKRADDAISENRYLKNRVYAFKRIVIDKEDAISDFQLLLNRLYANENKSSEIQLRKTTAKNETPDSKRDKKVGENSKSQSFEKLNDRMITPKLFINKNESFLSVSNSSSSVGGPIWLVEKEESQNVYDQNTKILQFLKQYASRLFTSTELLLPENYCKQKFDEFKSVVCYFFKPENDEIKDAHFRDIKSLMKSKRSNARNKEYESSDETRCVARTSNGERFFYSLKMLNNAPFWKPYYEMECENSLKFNVSPSSASFGIPWDYRYSEYIVILQSSPTNGHKIFKMSPRTGYTELIFEKIKSKN